MARAKCFNFSLSGDTGRIFDILNYSDDDRLKANKAGTIRAALYMLSKVLLWESFSHLSDDKDLNDNERELAEAGYEVLQQELESIKDDGSWVLSMDKAKELYNLLFVDGKDDFYPALTKESLKEHDYL